eukprot:jgi/Chlat1/8328/Chrsp8S00673
MTGAVVLALFVLVIAAAHGEGLVDPLEEAFGSNRRVINAMWPGQWPDDNNKYIGLVRSGINEGCSKLKDCQVWPDAVAPPSIRPLMHIEMCAARHAHVIVASFMWGEAVEMAAEAYPDTLFTNIDFPSDPILENVESLVFADDQAGYLAGVIAGSVAKQLNNLIVGAVGGFPVPPVKRLVYGFASGVHAACPDCRTYCHFAMHFINAANEGQSLGKKYAQNKVSVLYGAGGLTGSAAITAAAEAGVYVIGADADEWYSTFQMGHKAGANKVLTSTLKDIHGAVAASISRGASNSFRPGVQLLNLTGNGIGIAPCHQACDAVGDAVWAMVESIKQELALGTRTTDVDFESGDFLGDKLCHELA